MKDKGKEQSIVNGAKQKRKKKRDPAGYRTRVARSVVVVLNHNITNASWKKTNDALYVISLRCTCSSIKIHEVAVRSQMVYDY
jgi:hypothetical protein